MHVEAARVVASDAEERLVYVLAVETWEITPLVLTSADQWLDGAGQKGDSCGTSPGKAMNVAETIFTAKNHRLTILAFLVFDSLLCQ
ncbi:hypothetical protein [Halomonas nitroreducens]|uniref:Uncharacterized protein n=1 Tax=Halomonas nitroreducens TaxID=447425 RepID=A0A3S0HR38_9GAMM|nr:hypothetical protein [Halomonas nitroreducens]RTR05324.1 hypothetical protein EKG36_06995 [Halomonas nitroreducens]